jgi:hypothetical protein
MPSVLSKQRMRQEVIEYLAGRQSLNDFYAWFMPATLEVEHESKAVRDLAYQIKLHLAEYHRGHLTADELRQVLAGFIKSSRSANNGTMAKALAGRSSSGTMAKALAGRSSSRSNAPVLAGQERTRGVRAKRKQAR